MKSKRLFMFVAVLHLTCLGFPQNFPTSGTAPFVFDGNRMYAELSFIRPDGSVHRALAFVDMGSPSMVITAALFKELHIDQRHAVEFPHRGLDRDGSR